MAGVALQTGIEVVTGLASCCRTIMTARAGAGYTVVVEVSGLPGIFVVALITLSIGLDVISVFASCRRAIVAAFAGAR